MKLRFLCFIFILCLIALLPVCADAVNITSSVKVQLDGQNIGQDVLDGKESTFKTIPKGSKIQFESSEDVKGIYIVYELCSKSGKLNGNGKELLVGTNGFLHEYIDIESELGSCKNFSILYAEDVKIADIYVLGSGELPSFVEVWKKPLEKADIMLFSTHSDDEQLFFLGLLPTYVARMADVQVVYFASHNDTPSRLHEQIHGLYTVGIRNYPVLGKIPDSYSESLNDAMSNMKSAGITEEDALQFQVELIRRFKPQVIVGHDESGEYGHGQHILNTYLLEKAIPLANDSSYDETTVKQYGTWQAHKVYLHSYAQNSITMDYDTPLDYFDGKTAYEVSKEGYSKHLSQQWTWFTSWINGKNNEYTKATDITTYSPLYYGLYYTDVGEDVNKNDMLENITLYKEQEIEINDESSKIVDTVNDKVVVKTKKTRTIGQIIFRGFLIIVLIANVIWLILVFRVIVEFEIRKYKKRHKRR